MKKLVLIIVILFLPFVQAIIITEVELNPVGSDSGNEWVEFYSNEEIDLNGYILKNNDDDEIDLSEKGSFSGYYVIQFEKQWLDNSDERVFLFKGDELVDKTDLLKDSENNDFTLSYCEKEWKFVESSKGEKNNCPKENDEDETEEEKEEANKEDENNNVDKKLIGGSNGVGGGEPEVEDNVISLNPQTIKSNENFEEGKSKGKTKYAFYGFVLFCILLLFLFVIKKLNYMRKSGIA